VKKLFKRFASFGLVKDEAAYCTGLGCYL